MRIQSQLCHIDDKRAVVTVSAWEDEKPLGTTLGEGGSINLAEDNGIKRLLMRLRLGDDLEDYYLEKIKSKGSEDPSGITSIQRLERKNLVLKANEKDLVQTRDHNIGESTNEPEEWSKELAELDEIIKKLKWTRVEENKYLLENFGYADRNRITSYKDLLNYICSLKDEKNLEELGADKESSIKSKLLNESDYLLKNLAWNTTKAREFLKLKMNLTSRQQLDHDQLVEFNNLLEVELSEIEGKKRRN